MNTPPRRRHSVVAQFSPTVFPYGRFAFALALGLAGTGVFTLLGLPLPWMLGALTACLVGSLFALPIAAPLLVRPPMAMIVGVLLGAGFTPQMVDNAAQWIPSLVGLVGFIILAGAACFVYLHRIGGLDIPTAYFAGMPGGLFEMVMMGTAHGGDSRAIALIQSSRILIIVMTLPLVLYAATGEMVGNLSRPGGSIADADWSVLAWIAGTGLVGIAVGRAIRLPAADLLGPMVASAAVHLAGITEFQPPNELVAMAQVVLGTQLGCRFVGARPRQIARILRLSLGSTAILVALSVAFSLVLSRLAGLPLLDLLLAYAPGGLTETSLIALVLHVEVAFVATHHVLRVFLVMTNAPIFFRLFAHRSGRPPDGGGPTPMT